MHRFRLSPRFRLMRLPRSRAVLGPAVLAALTLAAALGLGPSVLSAQEAGAATPGGLRAYWHVFASYALVWVLVGGWLFAIARKLSRASSRMED